jgi:putative heme-binding domain-containing protein
MNADMRVRLKAQFELVNHGADGASIFEKVLSENSNQFAKIHSIWGISQLARKDKKWGKLLFPLLRDRDTEIRAQAAKWIGDTRLVDAAKYLIPLLKDSSSRARFFAAEALGRIAYEPAIGSIIEMLNDNNDQDAYLRHAGSLALARIGKSTPLVALSKDKSRALRIAAVVALRRMGSSEIAIFLNDTDEFVVTETARAINDDLSIKEALPALGNILTLTKFTNEALIRRAINANLRVGNEQALQNLIDYFSKENNPEKMRSESIETISTWSKPSVLDRVDGRYRGVILRDSLALKNKVGASVIQLLKSKEVLVRASAIKAIGKLSIKEGATTLMEMLKKDTSAIVRVEALKAIASMQDAGISEAIKMATTDKDKIVRVAGIGFLKKMNISQELMVSLLSEVIQTKTIEERQESLQTLGKLSIKNTRPVFESLLHQMETNQLPPDILLELSEAIDSSRATDLISRYKSASGKLSKDALTAAYAGALYGGDSEKGKRLFFKGEVAQCIKCHAYDDKGGNAGPRLNGVAKRLSRQLILESLINPSARLAPGYGVVNVTLKNGQSIGGILESENNKSIVLKAGNNQKQVIAKNEISKRENAASSMMEVKDYLTKKEIRDLVGFLSTLETD